MGTAVLCTGALPNDAANALPAVPCSIACASPFAGSLVAPGCRLPTLSSSSVLLDSDPDRSQFVVGAGVGDGVGGSVGGGVGTASEVMSETASGTASGTALGTASGKKSGKESGKASAMLLET